MGRLVFLAIFLVLQVGSKLYATIPLKKNPEDVKILLLIIASDHLPVYADEEKIWRSYMHSDPEHVEAYFIKGNPELRETSVILGDVIWSKTEESMLPGILNKTVLSLEKLAPRLEQEFDYVVRTNLSSFYVLPRLIDFVKTLPRTTCYRGAVFSGVDHDFQWVGGHGIIMSSDLASMIVKHKKDLINSPIRANDDLVIAWFFKHDLGVLPVPHDSMFVQTIEAWETAKNAIPENIFLFRTKCQDHLRMTHEIFIQQQLINMFYPELGNLNLKNYKRGVYEK